MGDPDVNWLTERYRRWREQNTGAGGPVLHERVWTVVACVIAIYLLAVATWALW